MKAGEGTDDALDILALMPDGPGRFHAKGGASNHIGTIFGGRMIAQALHAASLSVQDFPITALHAMFLARGRIDMPIDYTVERLRDSRRFANRQVHVRQEGRLLFTLLCEFHAREDSFVHQAAVMPDVPPPEAVRPLRDFIRAHEGELDLAPVRNFTGALPIDMRPIAPEAYFMSRPTEPRRAFWFRIPGAQAIRDLRLHQCLLAYASDYWLGGAAAITHAVPTNGEDLLISSLDHAVWFHQPVRCDEWLLHDTQSPAAGDGLGLVQGRIFARDGRLIATTTQECLLRRLR